MHGRTEREKDNNATTSNVLILMYCRGRCRAYCVKFKHQRQHEQQVPDLQGSRPMLTDPPLQLCSPPEVAQLGCLRGPETDSIGSELLTRFRGRATIGVTRRVPVLNGYPNFGKTYPGTREYLQLFWAGTFNARAPA